MSTKIILNVPFENKDEAKSYGAKWDSNMKKWYMVTDYLPEPLHKWLPYINANISANDFYLAKSIAQCWKCKKMSCVYGILLNRPFQYREHDESDIIIESCNLHSFVSYITFLDKNALQIIEKYISSSYRFDYSKTVKHDYLMNHCQFCDSKLGDFGIFNEPGIGFHSIDANFAENIKLVKIPQEIYLTCGGHGYGEPFFDYMKIEVLTDKQI